MKLKGRKFKTDARKYFFTPGVIKLWNSLPQEVVEVKNLAVFQRIVYLYSELQ